MNGQSSEPQRRVVVLGGGYAGTMAANRLAGRLDVVLVNPRDRFIERVRLHQWAAGSGAAAHDYSTILKPSVRLAVDTADRIDAQSRTVHLASGGTLSYDYLVYALGSGAGSTGIPGAAEHGFRVDDWESADRLRARLAAAPGQAVTVVGGGLTGVETAAELAERGHRVTVVSDGEIAPSISVKGRESTRATLGGLGVDIRENSPVDAVEPTVVRIVDGGEIRSDITVVTVGFAYPDLARRSGLACDESGRLRTDAALVSSDDPRIVGAGDAAAVGGMDLRNSCQAALPLGAQAAATVEALASGAQPKDVDMGFVGQCLSLGRRAATIQLSHRDDSPTRTIITGRLAAITKEAVCRATVWGLRNPRLYRWTKGGAPEAVVAETVG
ncbi:putative oxidoreductase [Gordonia araii NBRC 100433]|uniref:Putative oxidoreductase n=1 Tax=Gordonia araii NBRC 100433 TaxID=1073574 RepID=G7H2J9_9ACTN|nr:FAD-dependent oxidoreductase [Gordonia araii]NNG97730.1 FAD-dependent oxidoreductase [Gordonia araii NBRC 100433]GAB10074.1 putative oxidoreductase [Gordonia araii NBRC 100433]